MPGTKPGKIDVGEVFKKTLAVGLDLLKQAAIQKGSEIPAVQKAVEEQKVVAGKNILWKYFPFAILGVMGFYMLSKVK